MDYTRVSTFLTCPEKYRLFYDEDGQGHGLKLAEQPPALPLLYGQALHAGLAAHYLKQEAGKAFLQVYPEILDPREQVRTPVTGLQVLEAYAKQWIEVDQPYTVLSVEQVYRFDIGASEPWEVKYDAIVQHPTQGIFGLETKHTARREGFNETYWRGYEPNSQITGQYAGIVEKYGQCSGILVNGIHIGFNQKAGSKHPAGFWVDFQRQLMTRTQRQVEDWRLRMGRTIKRLRSTVEWEKNESQCTYCPMRALCMSCGDEQVRDTLYEVVGNPLGYLSEEAHT